MSRFSMHVGLELDFEVEDGEKVDMGQLQGLIRQGIEHLIQNGMFTQDSEAVLTNYTFDFDSSIPGGAAELEIHEATVKSQGHAAECECDYCSLLTAFYDDDDDDYDDEDDDLNLEAQLGKIQQQLDEFQHETDQRLLYLEECNRQRE